MASPTLPPPAVTSGGRHSEVQGYPPSLLSSSPLSSPPSTQQVLSLDTTRAEAPPAPRTKTQPRQRPFKQKMALSFKSLVSSAQKLVLGDGSGPSSQNTPSSPSGLFPATDPAIDGDDCDHDCNSCSIKYPRDFKIDEDDELYGHVKGWSTHVLVATGKSDWVRDVADEKGSVMEALEKYISSGSATREAKGMGRMMLSASNIPTPHGTTDYSEPTSVVLLPAFAVIHNVSPASVPALVDRFVSQAATSTTPLTSPVSIPRSVALGPSSTTTTTTTTTSLEAALTANPSPHNVLILLCSQKTRDARCGQSAPLLKRELERHLRPLGLYRDADDQRPGGVGIYFISHVGGHKYSANMMVYRRRDAYGVDDVDRAARGGAAAAGEFKIDPLARFKRETAAAATAGAAVVAEREKESGTEQDTSSSPTTGPAVETAGTSGQAPNAAGSPDGTAAQDVITDEGAAQCIWLARIKPEDCENVVRYTVLQGRVVKPNSQLRGGFDRGKGLVSW